MIQENELYKSSTDLSWNTVRFIIDKLKNYNGNNVVGPIKSSGKSDIIFPLGPPVHNMLYLLGLQEDTIYASDHTTVVVIKRIDI